jgi:hypothetical protein
MLVGSSIPIGMELWLEPSTLFAFLAFCFWLGIVVFPLWALGKDT